jgi:hypothetical protein
VRPPPSAPQGEAAAPAAAPSKAPGIAGYAPSDSRVGLELRSVAADAAVARVDASVLAELRRCQPAAGAPRPQPQESDLGAGARLRCPCGGAATDAGSPLVRCTCCGVLQHLACVAAGRVGGGGGGDAGAAAGLLTAATSDVRGGTGSEAPMYHVVDLGTVAREVCGDEWYFPCLCQCPCQRGDVLLLP